MYFSDSDDLDYVCYGYGWRETDTRKLIGCRFEPIENLRSSDGPVVVTNSLKVSKKFKLQYEVQLTDTNLTDTSSILKKMAYVT